MISRKKLAIIIVLCLIVLINLTSMIYLSNKMNIGWPNTKAKMLFHGAALFNSLYVIQIEKAFGLGNVVTVPFKVSRDFLFNSAVSRLNEQDAEKAVWWYLIKFIEYREVVAPKLNNLYAKKPSNADLRIYEKWTDEIYNNLKPLATLPLENDALKPKRFNMFMEAANFYINERQKIEIIKKGDLKSFFDNEDEIARVVDVLEWLNVLYEFTEQYKNEGIEHIQGQDWFVGKLLNNRACMAIVFYMVNKNKFSCTDPYFLTYTNTLSEIRNIMINKDVRFDQHAEWWVSSMVSFNLDAELYKITSNHYKCLPSRK